MFGINSMSCVYFVISLVFLHQDAFLSAETLAENANAEIETSAGLSPSIQDAVQPAEPNAEQPSAPDTQNPESDGLPQEKTDAEKKEAEISTLPPSLQNQMPEIGHSPASGSQQSMTLATRIYNVSNEDSLKENASAEQMPAETSPPPSSNHTGQPSAQTSQDSESSTMEHEPTDSAVSNPTEPTTEAGLTDYTDSLIGNEAQGLNGTAEGTPKYLRETAPGPGSSTTLTSDITMPVAVVMAGLLRRFQGI